MSDLTPTHVLSKTEAGVAAIKQRDPSLKPAARALLIMMDGVKTAKHLCSLLGGDNLGMDLLNQLVQNGFASASGGSAAAPPPSAAPASSPVATASPATASPVTSAAKPAAARDLKTSIRAATRFLEGWMGPGSEPFCLQLERCKSIGEFEAKVQEIKILLASARSVKKAEEFASAALGM